MEHINYQNLTTNQQKIYRILLEKLRAYETEIHLNATFQDIDMSYATLLEDHPEFFWLSGAFKTSTRGTADTKFFPTLKAGYTIAIARQRTAKLDAVVRKIIAKATWQVSTFDKILAVHDYMVDNTSYVKTAPNCYDAYGCLVEKRAVCGGYSRAFQLLMNCLNIPCGTVIGYKADNVDEKSTHAWNYVKIGFSFYFVDVTWDHNYEFSDAKKMHLRSYDYCLIDAKELLRTHRIKKRKFFVPTCTSISNNYHKHYGFYLKSYDFQKLKAIAEYQLRTRLFFTVRFETPQELQKAKTALLDKKAVFNIKGIKNTSVYHLISQSGTVLTIYNKP